MHRPNAPEERSALVHALQRSEEHQLPHLVLLLADGVEIEASARSLGPVPPTVEYERDVARHVCCPPLAEYQHAVFEVRAEGRNPDAVERPSLPTVPDDLPDAYRPMAEQYRPLMTALANRPRTVAALAVGEQPAWAVTGDFGFVSAGHLGLLEAR